MCSNELISFLASGYIVYSVCGLRIDDDSWFLLDCEEIGLSAIVGMLIVWNTEYLKLQIFHEATNGTDNVD